MIRLYRKGATHTVRGIQCEFKDIDEFSYQHELDNKWFLSPEEAYGKVEHDDDSIREQAKEAGIQGWHNKKIDDLLKELVELDEE